MNDRNAPEIESVEEMVGRFQAELLTVLPKWKDRLAADPSGLEELERDVHRMHARGADLLVAGLVAIVMKRPDFEKAAKQTRKNYRFSLAWLRKLSWLLELPWCFEKSGRVRSLPPWRTPWR